MLEQDFGRKELNHHLSLAWASEEFSSSVLLTISIIILVYYIIELNMYVEIKNLF